VSRIPSGNARLGRPVALSAPGIDPGVDLGELEAQEAPHLAGRQPTAVDPAIDRVLAHAQVRGDVVDSDPALGDDHSSALLALQTKIGHCGRE
jgi:hypothetical protein